MKYLITLYSMQNPRGTTIEIDANCGTEALNLKRGIIRKRVHEIRQFAARIKGGTQTETRRRRKEALHQIAWLHGTVERAR